MMEEIMNRAVEDNWQAGAGARVLREIIRTPAFLEIIKMNAKDLDPESAREVVRTFLWEDVELSLSVVGTVPEVVNYLTAFVLELGKQMNDFPGGLLEQYVEKIVAEIDLDVLMEYPGVFGPLLENVWFKDAAATAIGRTVNAATALLIKTIKQNPDFLRDTLSQVDGRQALRAVFAVAGSAIRWVISGISNLFARQ